MLNFYIIKGRAKRGRSTGRLLHDFLFAAFILLLVLSGAQVLTAAPLQSTTITGRVTDDAGAALPGANVVERGTTNGTVTDADGRYNITLASSDAVLVFSLFRGNDDYSVCTTRTINGCGRRIFQYINRFNIFRINKVKRALC